MTVVVSVAMASCILKYIDIDSLRSAVSLAWDNFHFVKKPTFDRVVPGS